MLSVCYWTCEIVKPDPRTALLEPAWPIADYDTIWTVTLDAQGNLTVNNDLCEGIDTTKLPVTAPQFYDK